MLSSPAKRRRISTIGSTAIDNATPKVQGRSNPTTPTRASYLSPTKASLARSHPHLVSRVDRRSFTEPRGSVSQNELAPKIMLDETNSVDSQEKQTQNLPQEKFKARTNQDDNFVGENSKSNNNTKAHESSATAYPSVPRSPLMDREPNASNQQQPFRLGNGDHQSQSILPKLVKRMPPSVESRFRPGSKEPDLPPTPVQLGVGPAPERPKGLGSSSSPKGSRSGSGRNRRRMRDNSLMSSSPLKPRNKASLIKETEDVESHQDSTQEAPESEAEEVMEKEPVIDSEEMKKKQKVLRDLRAELEAVKHDKEILEKALDSREESSKDGIDDELFLALKRSIPAGSAQTSLLSALQGSGEASAYHTLFAPGNLQLLVHTTSRKTEGRLKAIYTFTIVAPPPWPQHAFRAEFGVVTDAEKAQVERVYQKDLKPGSRRSTAVHPEFSKWVERRLSSSLHKFDIGGVIWGAGRYFDECVRRAKVFQKLDLKFNRDVGIIDDENEYGLLSEEQAMVLTRYLQKSQMTFQLSSDPQATLKVTFLWQIELNWTGSVRSTIEVIPSGVTNLAQSGMKQVFDSLLRNGDIVAAFEAVWALLKGESGPRDNEKVVPAGGRKGKRKRF